MSTEDYSTGVKILSTLAFPLRIVAGPFTMSYILAKKLHKEEGPVSAAVGALAGLLLGLFYVPFLAHIESDEFLGLPTWGHPLIGFEYLHCTNCSGRIGSAGCQRVSAHEFPPVLEAGFAERIAILETDPTLKADLTHVHPPHSCRDEVRASLGYCVIYHFV